MVIDATKKYREVFAFLLLGIVSVLLLTHLVSMLSASGFREGLPFSDRALIEQAAFVDPVYVILIVAAVIITTHLGEPSRHARAITMLGLGVLGVMAALGLISWIAGLSADQALGPGGSGKATGSFIQVSWLVLVGLAGSFTIITLSALPAPRRQAFQQPGWGGYDPNQGPMPGQYPAPHPGQPPPYGQGSPASAWSPQPGQPHYGDPQSREWPQPGQPWPQPEQQWEPAGQRWPQPERQWEPQQQQQPQQPRQPEQQWAHPERQPLQPDPAADLPAESAAPEQEQPTGAADADDDADKAGGRGAPSPPSWWSPPPPT